MMKKLLSIFCFFAAILAAPVYASIEIADPNDALSFARVAKDGQLQVVLVQSYQAGKVTGINLSQFFEDSKADPVELYLKHGYENILTLATDYDAGYLLTANVTELEIPIQLRDHHIATGTNYREHAKEAGVEKTPFLFAKMVTPTGPYADVHVSDALLDYEVELAFVTLRPLLDPAMPESMGLLLSNDYTDRNTLLRHVDISDVESGKGFTTGKSFPGYLPVGNLFVIPRDLNGFVDRLQLELTVNDEVRQSVSANEMIWSIDEILRQAWLRREITWEHRGKSIGLQPGETFIRDRVLIMAGTPSGTVFQGVSLANKMSALTGWLLGGWGRSLQSHAIDAYEKTARQQKIYLQPGDDVKIRVDLMGEIHNTIKH